MDGSRLLFTSGTARGGTNFRTLILNGHPNVGMAIDPFIPLFRTYRDSLLRASGHEDLLATTASGALDDYYFDTGKLRVMKAIQEADPDIAFDQSGWDGLKTALASRMSLGSMDLVPHIDELRGATFKEVFQNATQLVASMRGEGLAWAGFNDNWCAEFFRPIARLLPEAKFMLHLRDPRAVVNSSEFAEPDPRKRPTVLSFARHLRKYLALAHRLERDAEFAGRLLVTRYEPFLEDLAGQTNRMTDFLGLDYTPQMTDIDAFRKADGSAWESDAAIYRRSGGIWREEMPREMAELTEFICGPEMGLYGYRTEIYDDQRGLSPEALQYARQNARDCLGWRTDFPDIEHTIGCELYRRQLLSLHQELDGDEIERCFLFPDLFDRLLKSN
jgi:hypothetical protein